LNGLKSVKNYLFCFIIITACLFICACSAKNEAEQVNGYNDEITDVTEGAIAGNAEDADVSTDKAGAGTVEYIATEDIATEENAAEDIEETSYAKEALNDDNVSSEFIQKYYDFTEQTAVHIFCSKSRDNQLYAPFNLYLAMSVLAELTGGEAWEEMQKALGFSAIDSNRTELNKAISALDKRYLNVGRVKIKNSLWLNDNIKYKDDILSTVRDKYGTEIFKGDFQDAEFQQMMTDWVSQNTNQGFKPDYSDLSYTGGTFVALNTLDYYEEWITEFDEESTSEDYFTCSDNSKVLCEFMNMEEEPYSFLKGEDFISTYLHLKDKSNMLFILPDEGIEVEDFLRKEGKLADIIYNWANYQTTIGKVKLSIPKFAYADENYLNDTVKAIGINKIFDVEENAFSNLTDENIFVGAIKQASKIKIDEYGCSASSYTEVNLFANSGLVGEDEAVINLNRPFIYVLYKEKLPFLIGVVRNPLNS